MRQHKGFSILELVVVIAISSLLLTVTGLGFNALSSQAAKTQILDSERTIGLIIAQLVSTGKTITTGYYTPASFTATYGVALPGNPLNSSDPTQGQWYIQNDTGTYNVYAAKDGSYIASTKYVVNNEFPYMNNISKTVTVPTTTEYSSSAPIREKNLLYNGSFEKGNMGYVGTGAFGLSADAYKGDKSLMIKVNGINSSTLKQELSVSNLPLDRYYAVMHFKNVSADPTKTSVAFDFYYKTPTATVFSYTWTPTLSDYTWQEKTFISNVVGSKTGTVGIAVTVKGTATTATGYVLIDDLGLYLLPGGE